MTLNKVKSRVQQIKDSKNDPEKAHSYEDDLYSDFVEHIAKTGTVDQRKLAKEIMKSQEIDFPRWCA